jgi:hypothetical protein
VRWRRSKTFEDTVLTELADIKNLIQKSTEGEQLMSQELDALTAEVARNTTVEKSALALIKGFAAQLAAAGTDPVKLKALQASLAANDDELAAAVAANTPVAPTPTPTPTA